MSCKHYLYYSDSHCMMLFFIPTNEYYTHIQKRSIFTKFVNIERLKNIQTNIKDTKQNIEK